MKVLVIGGGAREHALVRGLSKDRSVTEIHAAPANAGIALDVTTHPVDVSQPEQIATLARELEVDLVVIGPEVPLVAGAADAVRAAGIACFGPSAAGAQLEASKDFAKQVMHAAGVPTARAITCDNVAEVEAALTELGSPYVVKDDGLAAGKGVVVTDDRAEAVSHARACLAREGSRVLIEEFLDGPEVSLFCVTDGTTVLPLRPAQDFKRVGEADTGPNTGGMGAYTPLPWAPAGLVEQVINEVAVPTINEMRRRGTPFSGLLYVGLALTSNGLRVVEFNARFGDPETQVVLEVLESGLGELLLAAATGRLAAIGDLRWKDSAAVTVVVAASGYPASPRTGDVITGLDAANLVVDATVLHAGTALAADGSIVSSGGRVLSVVGVGEDLEAARSRAYEAVAHIDLAGSHFRRDIAAAAVEGQVVVPATFRLDQVKPTGEREVSK